MKKWQILQKLVPEGQSAQTQAIVDLLLQNRTLRTPEDISNFLHPKDPQTLTPEDVSIDKNQLESALQRIQKAIIKKESIVIYADYDADGITAGAIMWETLHAMGARVMPYIPHRVDEGYGLSNKGIDSVKELYKATLIITVDHGITAYEKVNYAKSLGIEVIVTDHHVKPDVLPDCTIVHASALSGSGVSWFVAKELLNSQKNTSRTFPIEDHIGLATIGTIADLIPLVGINRAIVLHGLKILHKNKRIGLSALFQEAGVTVGSLTTYDISHIVAPRLNAVGRLEHAIDALRLLCTKNAANAEDFAQRLGSINRDRQQLTIDTTLHAKELAGKIDKNIIFISHESYNQGIVGLVAGKLVEEFYKPAIVIAKGNPYSKASARSIPGFNIVEAIRASGDLLLEVGGHPMAAGFSIETKNLPALQERLEKLADKELDGEKLKRVLYVDVEIPLENAHEELWTALQSFAPFGFGNSEPVFVSRGVRVLEARLIGKEGKHLKLKLSSIGSVHSSYVPKLPKPPYPISINAVAFNFGRLFGQLQGDVIADIAYTLDMNTWNGNKNIQLKIKDIQIPPIFS